MKLLRTIRFDVSDDHVYDPGAGHDEWAIPGSFAFAGLAPGDLKGKLRQAFRNGFLSLEGFGRSTFTTVAPLEEAEHERLAEVLAAHFVERYGAPDLEAARPAAMQELAFTLDLCADLPVNTLLTVRREFSERGDIREEFRTVDPPAEKPHARVWEITGDD